MESRFPIKEIYMKKIKELFDNPAPRVPVCLCLDVSGSMNEIVAGTPTFTGKKEVIDGKEYNICNGGKTKLEFLKEGIRVLYDDLRSNSNTKYIADISIVTFSDNATVITDFSGVKENPNVYEIRTGGMTEMGKGVNLALDLLETRKNEYKEAGVEYYQPWLFLMTDGDANGDRTELKVAQKRVNDLVKAEKLIFIPVGFGNKDAFSKNNEINKFSETEKAVRYDAVDYVKFFKWISASIEEVSASRLGDKYRPANKPSGYQYMD